MLRDPGTQNAMVVNQVEGSGGSLGSWVGWLVAWFGLGWLVGWEG